MDWDPGMELDPDMDPGMDPCMDPGMDTLVCTMKGYIPESSTTNAGYYPLQDMESLLGEYTGGVSYRYFQP